MADENQLDPELAALDTVLKTLAKLDDEARKRVIEYTQKRVLPPARPLSELARAARSWPYGYDVQGRSVSPIEGVRLTNNGFWEVTGELAKRAEAERSMTLQIAPGHEQEYFEAVARNQARVQDAHSQMMAAQYQGLSQAQVSPTEAEHAAQVAEYLTVTGSKKAAE